MGADRVYSYRMMSFPVVWRMIMGAAVFTGIVSYLLLLGALLSDRGKPITSMPEDLLSSSSEFFFHHQQNQEFHFPSRMLASLQTDVLDRKEALFSLVDDKEWRILIGDKIKRRKRAVDTNYGQFEDDLNCDDISKMIPSMDFLAAGWTKAVYKAKTGQNKIVAVKMVDLTGQDMTKCLDERRRKEINSDHDVEWCYQRAARKLIKEIAVLKLLLEHPNVVKVLGYCVPKKTDHRIPAQRVSLVTELGEPVNLIRLLQLSWEDRLRIVLAVARLTDYFSRHPSGSLVMNDMRRQQFVISSNGDLKLVDVDDVGLEEPNCNTDEDCRKYLSQILGNEGNATLVCMKNKLCSGANELRNIYNAARHFTTFLLPYGVPYQLQSDVDRLVDSFRYQTLSAHQLRQLTESLVRRYASGAYLSTENNTAVKTFVAWPDSDLPGQFDYVCESSLIQTGCSLSVASLDEARCLCAAQDTCRAFVWMNEKTWTGRTIVYFKNDIRTPTHRQNATLYVKVSP